MRDVDERVVAVQRRVRRIKHKRDRAMIGVLGTCTVLVLVCVFSLPFMDKQFAVSDAPTLLGSASLFGPSVGGYVLVALVTAVVVGLVTALFISRRKKNDISTDDEKQKMSKERNA